MEDLDGVSTPQLPAAPPQGRTAIRRTVAISRLLVLGALALGVTGTVSFGLVWLNLASLSFVYPSPPTNSAALSIVAIAVFLALRPFSRSRASVILALVAASLAATKPLFWLTGDLQSPWSMTNPIIVWLLSASIVLLNRGRPVRAQVAAATAGLVALLAMIGLVYGLPNRPTGALAFVYGSGFLSALALLARTSYRGPLRHFLGHEHRASAFATAGLALSAFLATYFVIRNPAGPYLIPVAVVAIVTLIIATTAQLMPYLIPHIRERAAADKISPLVREIDLALAQHEFEVVFQPQVELTTGHVAGVEALARWHHRARGSIPPSDFIPLAEQSGRIIPLGIQILEMACTTAARWEDPRLKNAKLTVNVSPAQLRKGAFAFQLRNILERTGFPADRLVLELTESAMVKRGEPGFDRIWDLHKAGVQLAIDDFGTGYSCLAYLRDLPVQYLKIDRSFVRDLPDQNHAVTVARSIVGLGHGLGLIIIAEGVETAAQVQFLREIGCQKAQGFYFSRPLDEPALRAWVSHALPAGKAKLDIA